MSTPAVQPQTPAERLNAAIVEARMAIEQLEQQRRLDLLLRIATAIGKVGVG